MIIITYTIFLGGVPYYNYSIMGTAPILACSVFAVSVFAVTRRSQNTCTRQARRCRRVFVQRAHTNHASVGELV